MSQTADRQYDVESSLESICELFSRDRYSEVFEYLLHNSASPLQVPFNYLKLVRAGKAGPGSVAAENDALRSVKPTAEQVELAYRAILQRAPEDRTVVRHQIETCNGLDQLVTALLTSKEAILHMPQLFARAFPMMRRLWHVHIPKTAGTSFFDAATETGWGYVNANTLSGAVDNLQELASAVCVSSDPNRGVVITGHWKLFHHLHCIGPFDRVVVFVRDPLESFISEFNFAVDVVNRRPNVHLADPKLFLDRGLDPDSFTNSYENGFFTCNVQCSFLADDATCQSALRNLAKCNADLLPSDAANQMIGEIFPAAESRRANVSNKHISSLDLGRSLREELLVQCNQDFLLNQIARTRHQEMRLRHGI